MTSPTETAPDHQTVPEDDQNMPKMIWDPAGAVLDNDPQQRPETFGTTEAPETFETPEVVSVPAADPEPTPAAPVAGDDVSLSTSWHEVLALFVDDPRSSADRAAGLVGDSVERFVVSVRERQHALLSAWQGDDAGTEEMRTAVQHYRTLARRLEDFSREA